MGEQRTVIPGHNGPTDPSAFGGLVAARAVLVRDHPDWTRTELGNRQPIPSRCGSNSVAK